MRTPDVDRIRSEKSRSAAEFLASYNENLPASFPKASAALLTEFKNTHEALFKAGSDWSLDVHRKKFMDWVYARVKPL